MRIAEIGGEFKLIDRLAARVADASLGLCVGIGDDAAVLRPAPDHDTVVTVDMLIEGVHFRRDWSDMYSIGWKSAAVNLSDIAAMGANPDFAFLSLALTPADTVELIDAFYDGFLACLACHGGRLAGGDTNATPAQLIVGVTFTGSTAVGKSLLRSGARPGDVLIVTGTLGDSAAGLVLLSQSPSIERNEPWTDIVLARHRRPVPRVAAGRAAAATGRVRAAMDLSDGLGGDLPKLCRASSTGAHVDCAALPISDAARAAAEHFDRSALEFAVAGGEDFELLLAVDRDGVDLVVRAIEETGVPATVIGQITPDDGITYTGLPDDRVYLAGWDHFSQ